MTVLVLSFAAVTLVQLGYWAWVLRIPSRNGRIAVNPPRSLSIIVCFRNARATLADCVASILAQNHPDFELILVNDNSEDGSVASLGDLRKDARVRLLDCEPTRPGKKDALTKGIAAARHEHLLLTDADCVAAGPEWARGMAAGLVNHNVVLGLSPLLPAPGWLNRWQRFEATYTALQYLGFARHGRPYMGVGRNLAYRKSFFQKAGGFSAHAHLAGGDDDLLIGGGAAGTVAIAEIPAWWTWSAAQPSWGKYFRQKLRHFSVGTAYAPRFQWLLGGLALSHGLHYLLALVLVLAGQWPVALVGLLLRWPFVYRAYAGEGAVAFRSGVPTWRLLPLDAALCFYYLVAPLAFLVNKKRW